MSQPLQAQFGMLEPFDGVDFTDYSEHLHSYFMANNIGQVAADASDTAKREAAVTISLIGKQTYTPPLAGDESISGFQSIEGPHSTTPSEQSLSLSDSSSQWSIPTNFDPEEDDSESVDLSEPLDEEISKGKKPIKRKKAEAVSNCAQTQT